MSQAVAPHLTSPNADRLPSPIATAVIFSVMLLCFLPLLVLHFRQLWLYEHYQYFPLLILAYPIVIDRIRGKTSDRWPVRAFWQWPLMIGGLLALALAVLGWSPNLAAVGFVLTCGGILWHYYQRQQIGRFFSAWFVLFFLIKLPLNMDVDLTFWLQGITSRLSSRLVDFAGINHFLAGHSIKIADANFAVEEACSGIQSLFSLLAMTALILALFRRSLVHSILLMFGAVFWACIINTIRVATVVISYEKLGIDLTTDRPHEILGLVLFAVALGLMYCTDRLLLFFTADDTFEGDHDEIEHFRSLNAQPDGQVSAPHRASDCQTSGGANNTSIPYRLLWGLVVPFLMLAVLQLAVLSLTSRGMRSMDPDDPRLANLFKAESIPSTFGNWRRKNFSTKSRSLTNYQGRHSAQWVYASDMGEVIVGVDYPFLGWHELTGCYVAEGCNIDDREIIETDKTVRATITLPSGETARLIFGEFTTGGQQMLPLGNNAGTVSYWRSRLQSALIRQFASFQNDLGGFQVQLLYIYEQPPDANTEAELRDLHRTVSKEFVSLVTEATSADE